MPIVHSPTGREFESPSENQGLSAAAGPSGTVRRITFQDPPRSPSVVDRSLATPLTQEDRPSYGGRNVAMPYEGEDRNPLARTSASRTDVRTGIQPRRDDTSPVRSVTSARSTSSVTARIRQAQFEADERLAMIRRKQLDLDAEQIQKRLAYEIETFQESEEVAEQPTDKSERINRWIHDNAQNSHVQDDRVRRVSRGPERDEQKRDSSKSPNPKRRSGVEQLVEAMEQLSRNRPPPRQVYDLPAFNGAAHEWFAFKAAMTETTRLFKFGKVENMARLRNSLKGEAKEAVAGLLHTAQDPQEIMRTLEQCFGRPEIIVHKSLEDLKKLPRPGASAGEFNTFAVKVQNIVGVLRNIDNKGYLKDPSLTQHVLSKLAPHIVSRWCDYAMQNPCENETEIVCLSKFLMKEADIALRYAYTSVATRPLRESTMKHVLRDVATKSATKQEMRKSVYDVEGNCTVCNQGGDHTLVNCPDFKKLSVDQ